MGCLTDKNVLVVWQVCTALPLFMLHVLSFCMSATTMTRAFNTDNDWSNPANGHLSDHMNAVYRNAISMNPYQVLGTQVGVSIGSLIFTPLTACLLVYGRFKGNTLLVGFLQLLLIFANFVPGALGWISLKNWGCANIVYGTDRSNASDNEKAQNACNDYKGASTMMLMTAGLYVFCFISSVVFAVRGIAHKTARDVRSTSNV